LRCRRRHLRDCSTRSLLRRAQSTRHQLRARALDTRKDLLSCAYQSAVQAYNTFISSYYQTVVGKSGNISDVLGVVTIFHPNNLNKRLRVCNPRPCWAIISLHYHYHSPPYRHDARVTKYPPRLRGVALLISKSSFLRCHYIQVQPSLPFPENQISVSNPTILPVH
jgi:hypothetical protein